MCIAQHQRPEPQRNARSGKLWQHLCFVFSKFHCSSKDLKVAHITKSFTVFVGIQWTGNWTPIVRLTVSSVLAGSARARPSGVGGEQFNGEHGARVGWAGWVVQGLRARKWSEASWVYTRWGGLPETQASGSKFQGNQSGDGSEAGRVGINWSSWNSLEGLAYRITKNNQGSGCRFDWSRGGVARLRGERMET